MRLKAWMRNETWGTRVSVYVPYLNRGCKLTFRQYICCTSHFTVDKLKARALMIKYEGK